MIKNLSKNNFKKKNSEENILKNSNNNTIKNKNLNLSNLNYYKSEIDRKVEELSNRLRNEMNKAIEEEKINELKRSKEYSNSFDINDKKKIEEKNKILFKFDYLIRKKKKIDEELIKEIFPDDEEIYKQLNSIRKSRSELNVINNKISSTTTSRNVNLSYSNYYKDEIEKKVEELSNRLRNDMNKAIEQEKINEEKRSKEYLNAKDVNEKKRIEEKNAIERENANKRILQMKQNCDKTIKSYEEKLKRDYQVFD
jgi:hypothetical protein